MIFGVTFPAFVSSSLLTISAPFYRVESSRN